MGTAGGQGRLLICICGSDRCLSDLTKGLKSICFSPLILPLDLQVKDRMAMMAFASRPHTNPPVAIASCIIVFCVRFKPGSAAHFTVTAAQCTDATRTPVVQAYHYHLHSHQQQSATNQTQYLATMTSSPRFQLSCALLLLVLSVRSISHTDASSLRGFAKPTNSFHLLFLCYSRAHVGLEPEPGRVTEVF
jgi:hypothetical protein